MNQTRNIHSHHFDAGYIEGLRNGRSEVKEHFYTYFNPVLSCALRKGATAPEAIDDIRQETFARVLAILNDPDGLRMPERFGAFVVSVCKNVRREYFRAGNRFSMEDESLPDKGLDPETHTLKQEIREQVQRTLEELSELDRRVLVMALAEEYRRPEICEQLGVKPTYLPVLLHRAKCRFRKTFIRQNAEQTQGAAERRAGAAALHASYV